MNGMLRNPSPRSGFTLVELLVVIAIIGILVALLLPESCVRSMVDLNTVVSICGMTIQPGDLLHGDASGLVSIPLDLVDKVIARAHEVRKAEAAYFDFLQSDRFNIPELKKRMEPGSHK